MTEAEFTYKLTSKLRKLLPEATVFKHADGYTAGIPDFSLTIHGRTSWVEVKLITNKKIFEPLQLATLKRLGGWYIVWDPHQRLAWLFRADEEPEHAMYHSDALIFKELCDKICHVF